MQPRQSCMNTSVVCAVWRLRRACHGRLHKAKAQASWPCIRSLTALELKRRATASEQDNSRPFSPIQSPRRFAPPWLPHFTPYKEVSLAGGLQRGKIWALREDSQPRFGLRPSHYLALKKNHPPIGRRLAAFLPTTWRIGSYFKIKISLP